MRKLHTEIFTLRVIYPAEASVHMQLNIHANNTNL